MCGICGIIDLKQKSRINQELILKMVNTLGHRGPDDINHYIDQTLAFGFSRLSIIDLEGGMQPLFNEDKSIIMVCNGEIFNYVELRKELIDKGHKFRTKTDIEVIVHLYEEYGNKLVNYLNGQFAFVIYDFKKGTFLCAKDHFGIIPFYYTVVNDFFVFASEVKAILEFPHVNRDVDMVGLDQVFTFPGIISPKTMFKNISSLQNGHYIVSDSNKKIRSIEYWDLIYPEIGELEYNKSDDYYTEKLDELITRSVKLRLRSDVDVGLYISGGLDSSLIAAKVKELYPEMQRHTFSIDFQDKEYSELYYQKIISDYINSIHHDTVFSFEDISKRLRNVIYHCETPLKETYNTASLALSEMVRDKNIKVVLAGEGADEFFAGYVGYRFDKMRMFNQSDNLGENDIESIINDKIWGNKSFLYEKKLGELSNLKKSIYSKEMLEKYNDIDCLNHHVINKERLRNRDVLHQRSYIDYKLRIVDHLVSDHGDRMAYANSVEVRYPFLDKDLVEFVTKIPPRLKLNDFEEKYILKQVSRKYVPNEIIEREKFSFVANGSPDLLKNNYEYINDVLSYERIKRQGFFNPDAIEKLKKQYKNKNFQLNLPFDSDLLIIVLTFGIFLDKFKMNTN